MIKKKKLKIINPFPNKAWFLPVYSTSPLKSTEGKGGTARNEQFLLFLQCFSTHLKNYLLFSSDLKLLSANSSVWKHLKFVVWKSLNIMNVKNLT